MNEKEVNEYMEALLEGKAKVEGIELNVLQLFKNLSEDVEKAQSSLEKAQSEVERLRNLIVRINGNREAYAQILILAESDRRKAQMTGLDNLRKKMGATKLEILDNQKNVRETSEG